MPFWGSHLALWNKKLQCEDSGCFGVVSRIVGASSVVLSWSFGLGLNSVESPCRVLAFCKNFV